MQTQANMRGVDKSEINRALAKALAYQQCGKLDEARQWGSVLKELLRDCGILA